jgi:hypothetical protein
MGQVDIINSTLGKALGGATGGWGRGWPCWLRWLQPHWLAGH